ncbi:hypothetical protein IE53DRAFT_399513 [Violaceomyces palustris]|uniref:Uncharacterized protein n=1 Tax=Violaceomyces palustris TaxID=1673888 RepID=A0ACD0NRU4_9BASI|nr:hypothetical protein IE53DRAFT_399513 [Violaceomyces palustris]
MALNWAMLDDVSCQPVPLPEEQTFFQVGNCSLSLKFGDQKVHYEAEGSCYVTNQRVVFVKEGGKPSELVSLSVPLDHFCDYRYIIPIFTAPYIESTVYPVEGGGLPQREPGATSPPKGDLRLWFAQGGGLTMKEALGRAKANFEERRNARREEEQLPAYEE